MSSKTTVPKSMVRRVDTRLSKEPQLVMFFGQHGCLSAGS